MARRVTPVFLFMMLLVCGIRATAQSRAQADPANDAAIPIHLGLSMVPLYGPWKFQVGDSPIDPATNQPLWAQPKFDDATWETVDLTPKDPVNPFQGSIGVCAWLGRAGPSWLFGLCLVSHPGEGPSTAGRDGLPWLDRQISTMPTNCSSTEPCWARLGGSVG